MNYRHAFHAGNFADVHKHSILARVLLHLRLKPGAFRVIDTHAGSGRYDLCGSEATRSGEWHQGIERVWRAREAGAVHDLIKPYLDVVAALNPGGELRTYPGSPLIAQSLLRAQDRLIACELEPGSARALAATLRGDRRAKALRIDGWTAAAAYVPPPERRGLSENSECRPRAQPRLPRTRAGRSRSDIFYRARNQNQNLRASHSFFQPVSRPWRNCR